MTRRPYNRNDCASWPARVSRLLELSGAALVILFSMLMLTIITALVAANSSELAGFVTFLSIIVFSTAIGCWIDALREPAAPPTRPPLRVARLKMPPRSARLRRLRRMFAKPVALRWNCPNCAAALIRSNEVSPSGDVKCLHCDSWYNVNC